MAASPEPFVIAVSDAVFNDLSWRLGRGERITVPTAVAGFPREIIRPPRERAAQVCNL